MRKMYNNVVELLPELIESFTTHAMFDMLEEGDVLSFLPIEDPIVAEDYVAKTNQVLADFFEVEDGELCYEADSYKHSEDNPIFFWKDYLNCFFTLELVDGDSVDQLPGTAYGMYRIVEIAYIDEVNKRLKKRRLNGIRLEYKVQATAMDRNKHWNRTYDKDF